MLSLDIHKLLQIYGVGVSGFPSSAVFQVVLYVLVLLDYQVHMGLLLLSPRHTQLFVQLVIDIQPSYLM